MPRYIAYLGIPCLFITCLYNRHWELGLGKFLYSRGCYGQKFYFSVRALWFLLGFLYDRMGCPEHSDGMGNLLEPQTKSLTSMIYRDVVYLILSRNTNSTSNIKGIIKLLWHHSGIMKFRNKTNSKLRSESFLVNSKMSIPH